MEEHKNKKKSFFSEWLEQLQQESWQLELLISGLALFGIWESQNVIIRFDYYIDVFATAEYRPYLNIFALLLWSSWSIFLLNLLVHIILRGFWIGAIGLRYVSGDIDFDTLNYSDRFKNYYKSRIGSFDEYIERIERLSSVIFSFTFLLFFMLLSFIVFNIVFALIMAIFHKFLGEDTREMVSGLFGLFYYGLGLIVLIDFFTLGAFKKIKENTISTIYFWIYRFYSTVSLSFFYRPLLLNFIDNTYTRKLFFLAIPYGIVLFILSGLFLENYSYFPSFDTDARYSNRIHGESIHYIYYDDEREAYYNTFRRDGDRIDKQAINYASLATYEITGSELKLFLRYTRNDGEQLKEEHPELYPFRKQGLRHSVFFSNRQRDESNHLDSLEMMESRTARSIIKNGKIPQEVDSSLVEKFKAYSSDELNQVLDEISSDYSDQRWTYQEERIIKIKEALKNLYSVKLDDLEINDELECEYYIHPNMRERGIMCYYSIDSLSSGKHMLKINKKDARAIRVPFRKLK